MNLGAVAVQATWLARHCRKRDGQKLAVKVHSCAVFKNSDHATFISNLPRLSNQNNLYAWHSDQICGLFNLCALTRYDGQSVILNVLQ